MDLKIFLILLISMHYAHGECVGADCNVFDRIIDENKKVANRFIEGDIPKIQSGSIDRRFNTLWPNNVLHYTMANSIPDGDKKQVREALANISAVSCLQFQEHTNNPPTNYVEVFRGSGCYSFIGRTGGRQQLSLAAGCMNSGIIIHEFFHALGFYHEQSRPDRNQFVRVNLTNVIPGFENNFEISNRINSLGSPYDPNSVMHYSRFVFSRNGNPTIELIANPQAPLGGSQMTTLDINQLNLLYQCPTTTPNPTTTVVSPRPSTPKPTSGPSTPKPTSGPSTPKPTSGSSTPKPTSGPSTPKPTSGSSTPKTTLRPTTDPGCVDRRPRRCRQIVRRFGRGVCNRPRVKTICQQTCRLCNKGCVDRRPRRCRQIVRRFGRRVCNRPKVQANCQQTCRLCNKGCVDRRPRRCRQIVRRFGRRVCNRPKVQANCQQTCRLCNKGCRDLGICVRPQKNPNLCRRQQFSQRCAQTCGMCN